jgi:hypothetical protein
MALAIGLILVLCGLIGILYPILPIIPDESIPERLAEANVRLRGFMLGVHSSQGFVERLHFIRDKNGGDLHPSEFLQLKRKLKEFGLPILQFSPYGGHLAVVASERIMEGKHTWTCLRPPRLDRVSARATEGFNRMKFRGHIANSIVMGEPYPISIEYWNLKKSPHTFRVLSHSPTVFRAKGSNSKNGDGRSFVASATMESESSSEVEVRFPPYTIRTLWFPVLLRAGPAGDGPRLVCDEAGKYHFVMRVKSSVSEEKRMKWTVDGTVTVKEPAGEDRKAWRLYKKPKVLQYVQKAYFLGSDLLNPRAEQAWEKRWPNAKQKASDTVGRILKEYPDTRYAEILRKAEESLQRRKRVQEVKKVLDEMEGFGEDGQ